MTDGCTASTAANGWWERDERGERSCIDDYLTERPRRVAWSGISGRNWHRPLSSYVTALLALGLQLTYFDEPAPTGSGEQKAARYRRIPYFLIMEWRKPAV